MKHTTKLKINFILLLFILITNNSIKGQTEQIILKGFVFDDNSVPIANAYIYYGGIKEYTYTNINGKFLLSITNKSIKKNNEIWIGSPGYISKRIKIAHFLNNDDKSIKIELEQESNLISEVVISAKHIYDGKEIINKAFKNINKTFINSDFTSEIHVIQTINEDNLIKKYRESYLSVFHKSGYSKMIKSRSKLHEIVYSGQIRETKDYSINKQQPYYLSISNNYWFFFYDKTKYRPKLIREFKNYNCFIVDSLKNENLILINCKQHKDTIANKRGLEYKYKTDYLISVSLDKNIIRSITSIESFFYQDNQSKKIYKRVFSTLIKANYTLYSRNNYLKNINTNFVDRGIQYDTLGNITKNEVIRISTKVNTKSVSIKKNFKVKKTFYPVYNESFWKNKPLYYDKSTFYKEIFIDNKLFFLNN